MTTNNQIDAKGVYSAHEELKAINRNTGSAAIIVSFSSQDLLTEYDAMAQLIATQAEALRVMRDFFEAYKEVDKMDRGMIEKFEDYQSRVKIAHERLRSAYVKANSLIGGE